MSSAARSASLERLEDRLLCARTPSDPTPSTIGRTFDLGERKALLARMTNLPSHTATVLAKYLKGHHTGAFDNYLLSYMRSRTDAKYYYDPNDAGTIASYVKAHLSISAQETHADKITDDRLFPKESSSTSYTVQLPNAIDWNKSYSTDSEFLPTLQRQAWWVDLAQSYRYTGNSKYMNELQYELASWSQQTPTFTLTDQHEVTYAFTVGVRVDFQMQAYFSVLDSSGWTGAANSLMLYKFMQQGDLLKSSNGYAAEEYDTNRSTSIGKAELLLGEVFPEFDTASQWEKGGRTVVTQSMAAQFYADGSQREQSPGYALNVLDDLLDAAQIDKLNGNSWTTDQNATLVNIVDALWQQLSPNGNRPAIGDTYRLSGAGKFTKASLVLGVDRWPENKANASDGWEFGVSAVSNHLHDQSSDLGARGSTYSLPDSGNYILRSGTTSDARQINYIAGPKGGDHGHFDYMSFELFGYGRPLIADPGPYEYTASANRTWVTSAAAHNTISVTGVNPADLENSNQILNSGITQVDGGYMWSSTYQGYSFLDGNPTLSRTVWYDGNNTMVVVDFANASSKTAFETGFTVEGQSTKHNLDAGLLYTTNSTGNVRIQSLLTKGESAGARTKGVFTSSQPAPNDYDPATHYYASKSGTYAVFATVITAYKGSAASQTNNVSWVRTPTKAGQSAILDVNGTHIDFNGPQFASVGASGQVKGEDNSIAYDSKGRLHEVFYDPTTQTLKYAVRSAKGVWGTIETIDGNVGSGITPSLAIDSDNNPHVAYQDGPNADLKYAYVDSDTNAWTVQTVDAKGAVGAYPSLVMSRKDGAMISYYDHTHGNLKVAVQDTNGWDITTVDSRGDVGRYSSIQLDPNRPDASKFAVAYADTTHHDIKYAIQSKSGFTYETVDGSTTSDVGYTSMKFFDDGTDYEPAVSYYDSGSGHLKFATRHGGVWSASTVTKGRRQGLYSQLEVVDNAPTILFFDGANNIVDEAVGTRAFSTKWTIKDVADGGRNISASVYKGHIAFSTFNSKTGFLTIAG